jgi:hypothetical protein
MRRSNHLLRGAAYLKEFNQQCLTLNQTFTNRRVSHILIPLAAAAICAHPE